MGSFSPNGHLLVTIRRCRYSWFVGFNKPRKMKTNRWKHQSQWLLRGFLACWEAALEAVSTFLERWWNSSPFSLRGSQSLPACSFLHTLLQPFNASSAVPQARTKREHWEQGSFEGEEQRRERKTKASGHLQEARCSGRLTVWQQAPAVAAVVSCTEIPCLPTNDTAVTLCVFWLGLA